MPTEALSRCIIPNCRVKTNGGRCDQHAKDPDSHKRKRTQRTTGYSSKRWKQLRRSVLVNNPMCVGYGKRKVVCNRPAVDVDHIVPVKHGGVDTVDNLQGLCKACHTLKTRDGL